MEMTEKNQIDSNQKSMLEASANIVGGFFIGIALNFTVVPWLYGIPMDTVDWDAAIGLSFVFGAISLIRSFILRRVFIRVRNDFDIKKWFGGHF